MTRDDGAASGSVSADVGRMQAEIEATFAGIDASEREMGRLREEIAARRAECLELESEAERLLRRLLVVAEASGNDELRAVARRELATIAAET